MQFQPRSFKEKKMQLQPHLLPVAGWKYPSLPPPPNPRYAKETLQAPFSESHFFAPTLSATSFTLHSWINEQAQPSLRPHSRMAYSQFQPPTAPAPVPPSRPVGIGTPVPVAPPSRSAGVRVGGGSQTSRSGSRIQNGFLQTAGSKMPSRQPSRGRTPVSATPRAPSRPSGRPVSSATGQPEPSQAQEPQPDLRQKCLSEAETRKREMLARNTTVRFFKAIDVNQKLGTAHSAFQAFDVNGDGVLSPQEFTTAINNLKLGLSQEEISAFAWAVDKDGDGHISYSEFLPPPAKGSDFSLTPKKLPWRTQGRRMYEEKCNNVGYSKASELPG